MKNFPIAIIIFAFSAIPGQAFAGGQSENVPWGGEAANEKANERAIRANREDMRMKRTSGFYSAPNTYTTTIGTQYNCSINASASGNGGSNSASANSAYATGSTGIATGNQTTSNVDPASSGDPAVLNNGQENTGAVSSSATGDGSSSASNNTSSQVLNTNQQNSGTQYATVDGATACTFAGMTAASR
jgi:hypothetical protein